MTEASHGGTPREGRLHAIERWTLGLSAVAALATFMLAGRELGLAVSLGAGLMSLNAIAMPETASRMVERALGECEAQIEALQRVAEQAEPDVEKKGGWGGTSARCAGLARG